MRSLVFSVAALALLSSSVVRADGLIHKLPKDGESVTYDLKMKTKRGDNERTAEGSLMLASVGKAKHDGEDCRWIELRLEISMNNREQKITAKCLIPEKQLAAGKSPIDHVKKCWLRFDDRGTGEVEDVKGNEGGPLPVFLAGPGKAKKLEQKTVECKLGKLKCVGVASEHEIKQGSATMTAKITSRLNDKVPFGVVTCEISMKVKRGDREEDMVFSLSANAVGSGEKTNLPDNK